jgi:hypothetical protein
VQKHSFHYCRHSLGQENRSVTPATKSIPSQTLHHGSHITHPLARPPSHTPYESSLANLSHRVGVIFFLIAAILLLITTISAPVIGDIAILKIDLANKTNIRHSAITYGTFGHCALDVPPIDTDQDYCSKKTIGYQAASIATDADGTTFGTASHDSIDGLTNTMVLHPIACGVAFLAFLISIGAGVIGSLIGSLVGALAWVLTLVAMAIDFSIFGVRDSDPSLLPSYQPSPHNQTNSANHDPPL